MNLGDLSLQWLATLLAGCGLVVLVCGVRMTGLADRIADRTGLGEALVGGVLLGAATSLSGSVVSLTAAIEGQASLAFANAVGGIAAQTAFLAFADLLYRRANLEHAAAELTNVFQGAMLILLLAIPLAAYSGPAFAVAGVHPASILLFAVYLFGVRLAHRVRQQPMWRPVETPHTQTDAPDEEQARDAATGRLIAGFAGLMLIMGLAGYLIAQAAGELIQRSGLSATLVGALLTSVLTSLPELVTTLAAVRRGALQLAVGGIIGGNTFDVLFITVSDLGYRDGSIYHVLTAADYFWLAVGIIMTAVLVLGQIYRERHGPGGIGVESLALLLIYASAVLVQTIRG